MANLNVRGRDVPVTAVALVRIATACGSDGDPQGSSATGRGTS